MPGGSTVLMVATLESRTPFVVAEGKRESEKKTPTDWTVFLQKVPTMPDPHLSHRTWRWELECDARGLNTTRREKQCGRHTLVPDLHDSVYVQRKADCAEACGALAVAAGGADQQLIRWDGVLLSCLRGAFVMF